MIDYIVLKIVGLLNNNNFLSEEEKEQISYSLKAIIGDLSKIIILLFIFSFFNFKKEFFAVTLYSIPLRIISGGYHFKNYSNCFIFTFIYYSVAIFSSRLFFDEIFLIIIFSVFSLLLLLLLPIVSKEREALRKYNINFYKFISLILISTYLLIYLLSNDSITKIGLIVVIIQSIQLLIMKGVKIHENISWKSFN